MNIRQLLSFYYLITYLKWEVFLNVFLSKSPEMAGQDGSTLVFDP